MKAGRRDPAMAVLAQVQRQACRVHREWVGMATDAAPQVATSVDEIEEAFQRKKRRELEQARMAGAGDRQTGAAESCAAPPKSDATILVPAAPARNTKSAAARRPESALSSSTRSCHPERSIYFAKRSR